MLWLFLLLPFVSPGPLISEKPKYHPDSNPCPKGEFWDGCGGCEGDCKTGVFFCKVKCDPTKAKCRCEGDLVRGPDGKCIRVDKCPSKGSYQVPPSQKESENPQLPPPPPVAPNPGQPAPGVDSVIWTECANLKCYKTNQVCYKAIGVPALSCIAPPAGVNCACILPNLCILTQVACVTQPCPPIGKCYIAPEGATLPTYKPSPPPYTPPPPVYKPSPPPVYPPSPTPSPPSPPGPNPPGPRSDNPLWDECAALKCFKINQECYKPLGGGPQYCIPKPPALSCGCALPSLCLISEVACPIGPCPPVSACLRPPEGATLPTYQPSPPPYKPPPPVYKPTPSPPSPPGPNPPGPAGPPGSDNPLWDECAALKCYKNNKACYKPLGGAPQSCIAVPPGLNCDCPQPSLCMVQQVACPTTPCPPVSVCLRPPEGAVLPTYQPSPPPYKPVPPVYPPSPTPSPPSPPNSTPPGPEGPVGNALWTECAALKCYKINQVCYKPLGGGPQYCIVPPAGVNCVCPLPSLCLLNEVACPTTPCPPIGVCLKAPDGAVLPTYGSSPPPYQPTPPPYKPQPPVYPPNPPNPPVPPPTGTPAPPGPSGPAGTALWNECAALKCYKYNQVCYKPLGQQPMYCMASPVGVDCFCILPSLCLLSQVACPTQPCFPLGVCLIPPAGAVLPTYGSSPPPYQPTPPPYKPPPPVYPPSPTGPRIGPENPPGPSGPAGNALWEECAALKCYKNSQICNIPIGQTQMQCLTTPIGMDCLCILPSLCLISENPPIGVCLKPPEGAVLPTYGPSPPPYKPTPPPYTPAPSGYVTPPSYEKPCPLPCAPPAYVCVFSDGKPQCVEVAPPMDCTPPCPPDQTCEIRFTGNVCVPGPAPRPTGIPLPPGPTPGYKPTPPPYTPPTPPPYSFSTECKPPFPPCAVGFICQRKKDGSQSCVPQPCPLPCSPPAYVCVFVDTGPTCVEVPPPGPNDCNPPCPVGQMCTGDFGGPPVCRPKEPPPPPPGSPPPPGPSNPKQCIPPLPFCPANCKCVRHPDGTQSCDDCTCEPCPPGSKCVGNACVLINPAECIPPLPTCSPNCKCVRNPDGTQGCTDCTCEPCPPGTHCVGKDCVPIIPTVYKPTPPPYHPSPNGCEPPCAPNSICEKGKCVIVGQESSPKKPYVPPPKCGENEEYSQCGNLCEGKCSRKCQPFPCIEICNPPACACKMNFFRDDKTGKCVTKEKCKECGGPPPYNQITPPPYKPSPPTPPPYKPPTPPPYKPQKCGNHETLNPCGNNCEGKCEHRPGPTPCQKICNPPACACDKDYFRNENKECVKVEKCTGPIVIVDPVCAFEGCPPGQICSQLDLACIPASPAPPGGQQSSPPKPNVPPPYKPVPPTPPPYKPPPPTPPPYKPLKCGKNEVVNPCGDLCEGKCEFAPQPTPCIKICNPPACACDKDYYRNDKKECVKEKQCTGPKIVVEPPCLFTGCPPGQICSGKDLACIPVPKESNPNKPVPPPYKPPPPVKPTYGGKPPPKGGPPGKDPCAVVRCAAPSTCQVVDGEARCVTPMIASNPYVQ